MRAGVGHRGPVERRVGKVGGVLHCSGEGGWGGRRRAHRAGTLVEGCCVWAEGLIVIVVAVVVAVAKLTKCWIGFFIGLCAELTGGEAAREATGKATGRERTLLTHLQSMRDGPLLRNGLQS